MANPTGDEDPPIVTGALRIQGDGEISAFENNFRLSPAAVRSIVGPPPPPGADGQDGRDGEPGPPGSPGPQGATGSTGSVGNSGPPGIDGLDGVDGAMGPPGAQGAQGATGASGSTGAPGPPGDDGASGIDGAPGPAGAQGAQGATGPSGAAGAAGPPGADGLDGADGPPGPLVGWATILGISNSAGTRNPFIPAGQFIGYGVEGSLPATGEIRSSAAFLIRGASNVSIDSAAAVAIEADTFMSFDVSGGQMQFNASAAVLLNGGTTAGVFGAIQATLGAITGSARVIGFAGFVELDGAFGIMMTTNGVLRLTITNNGEWDLAGDVGAPGEIPTSQGPGLPVIWAPPAGGSASQGPPGPPGTDGSEGPPGPPGTQGAQGPQGASGGGGSGGAPAGIVLDNVSHKLTIQSPDGPDLDIEASFIDVSGGTSTPGALASQVTGTAAVDLVTVPPASTQRVVHHVSAINVGTTTGVVRVFKDTGVTRNLVSVSLGPLERIEFTADMGWRVFDARGVEKKPGVAGTPFPGALLKITVYNTATGGTVHAYQPGTRSVIADVVGSGAGGDSATAGVGTLVAAGGGGSGQRNRGQYQPTQSTCTVVVGAGGAADGNGASSFLSEALTLFSAGGGSASTATMGAGTAVQITGGGSRGLGGTMHASVTPLLTSVGDDGEPGMRFSGTVGIGGHGGRSPVNGMGKGSGAGPGSDGGNALGVPGAGGGGACSDSATARTGGTGNAGAVIIEEYG